MLDSTDPRALDAGLKRLAGRSVVNSFNLEDGGQRARRLLALCRQHGAAAVGLAIDQRGMAADCRRKVEVARKLVALARDSGLEESDLFLDLLTFTLASGDSGLARAGRETLQALPQVKKMFPQCHTILGISNISHGLPPAVRPVLNTVFLHEALQQGLDAAILHAGRIDNLEAIDNEAVEICRCLIYDRPFKGRRPLEVLIDHFGRNTADRESAPRSGRLSPEQALRRAVIEGDVASAAEWTEVLLQKQEAQEILARCLMPAMDEVGRLFKSGRLQLPFVLRSAEAMKAATAKLSSSLGRPGQGGAGTMVLATVRGDIHDIGKDLVDMVLTASGYRVINLGVKKTAEEIIAAVRRHRPEAVGLSGLLVESARAMGEYLEAFAAAGLRLPVVCGGAALRRGFVEKILARRYKGRVFYAADAMEGLEIMRRICKRSGKRTRRTAVRP